jgi:peptidoglycan hydrolase-like protein with peptidoglycan-binding domain
MSEPWHDINAPGLRQKPKQPESNKPAVTDDATPPPPKKPLVKLSDGKFVPPDEGAEINKTCPVQVNVEYLDDSAKSMKKVTFSLYSNYNGQTSNLSHFADGYEKDGVAQAELILYPPPGYQDGDNVDYFFKAEHIRGEKVIDSEDITLPQETTMIVLQKGHYDENGAAAYDKPQSGDNFKPNNVVKKLQGDLITTAFLPESSDDGFFGDQTDKAVNDFQDYAIKSIRMKRSVGKTETTDTTLDQQAPDGIVGKKTRDELDKWLQNSWIKPIPTLRHGEYDDTGVQNGKGKSGTDDHHQGTPVVEAQQNLQKVGVYSDGAIDGWFFDKMLCGVKDFQSAAADATFSVNGKTTQFDQKLTGYQKGEMCPKTQEYLKMVVDKGGVVPPTISEEFKLMICTVYGEAAGCTEIAQRTIGHVIMNRLHDSGCKYFAPPSYRENVTSVISLSGFDAYTQKNKPYLNASLYFDNGRTPPNSKLEQTIKILDPIYHKSELDFSNGAVLYYSPAAQDKLHKENPNMYPEKPKWKFEELQELTIIGLDPLKDDFKFYKYK